MATNDNLNKRIKARIDKFHAAAAPYSNRSQVEQIVQRYGSLNTFLNQQSIFIQTTIDRLNELLRILLIQENNFYRKLGLNGPEGIKDVQTRINQWDHSGAHILLEDKLPLAIFNQLSAEVDKEKLLQVLNKAINSQQFATVSATNMLENLNLAEAFNQISGGHKFSTDKRGINARLIITQQDNKIVVTEDTNNPLSAGLARNMAQSLNLLYDNTEVEVPTKYYKDETKENIDSLILESVSGDVKSYLQYELTARPLKSYAVSANLFVIKGWLGELYWNACLGYIFNQPGISIPMGNIKNNFGQSLSVDAIIKGLNLGFQIKNWSIHDNNEKLSYKSPIKKMRLGNFMESRAQILSSEAGRIIAQMFGAASYNKVNTEYDGDKPNIGNYTDSYEQFYNSNLANVADDSKLLQDIFMAQLDKIIEIDRGDKALVQDKSLRISYLNTFWLINDKIIPSSVIVSNLIAKIQQEADKDLVKFTILNLTENEKGSTWPAATNYSDIAMANRWGISYELDWDLSDLLEAAANN